MSEHAIWPWHRCRSVGVFSSTEWARCELRRGHSGLHLADRGMGVVRWGPELYRMTE